MHKYIICALLICISITNASACDICGGISASGIFGVMPHQRTNYIGIWGNYAHFHYEDGSKTSTSDHFMQFQLRGRYYPTNRLQITASLPYNFSKRIEGELESALNGLGDAWFQADYSLFRKDATEEKPGGHIIIAGAGMKLPTGKYESRYGNNRLPANFQIGTGSLDYLGHLFYRFTIRNWSVNADLSGRYTTDNKDYYEFGNLLVSSLYAAWMQALPNGGIQPYAGLSHEILGQDRQGSFLVPHTGGSGTFLLLGSEFRFGNYAFGLNGRLPLTQSFGAGEIYAGPRSSVSFSYIIN